MTTMYCGNCGVPRNADDQRFCGECGVAYDQSVAAAPTPEITQPRTSMPTGAPPVPNGPYSPAADASQAASAPQYYGASAYSTPDYAVPAAVPLSQPPTNGTRHAGRAGKFIGVGALILAVGGAGVVGWQVLGPKGGADSPEAAASTFMNAVAEQDGIGVLSVVNPGEVDGLDDVYETARERLEEEGLIEGGEISGAVDVSFDNLKYNVDELGDGVARVTLAEGTMTASYDPDKLPERLAFVADEFPTGETEEIDLAKVLDEANDFESCDYDEATGEEYDCGVEESGIDLGLTTIEVDGRWYVSLLGTAADLTYQTVSEYDSIRRPDYDEVAAEVDPITGKDPEEVVTNLIDATNKQDVDALLDQLPADLSLGLRPYTRTIEKLLQESGLTGSLASGELELETEELDDDLMRVTIEEATFTGEAYADGESASGSVTLYDACIEGTGTSSSTYEDYDEYGEYSEYQDYSDGSFSECLPDKILDDAGIDRPYVLMRQVDDGYQLDPIATVTSYAATAVENAPSSLIDEAIEAIETQDGSFFECYVGDYCEDE